MLCQNYETTSENFSFSPICGIGIRKYPIDYIGVHRLSLSFFSGVDTPFLQINTLQ
jgi:hypothetical protein